MNLEPSLKELYERRRYHNFLLRKERIAKVYQDCAELAELDAQSKSLHLAMGRQRITGQPWTKEKQRQLDEIEQRRAALLAAHSYPDDYLDELYTCPHCHDMGHYNGKYCTCYLEWKADLLFSQFPLRQVLARENFSTFDFTLYSDTVTPPQPISPRQNIQTAYETARQFAADFPNGTNLLIHGPTGVGKSFLTNCIVSYLLQERHPVAYLSASELFELLGDYNFRRSTQPDAADRYQQLTACELLVIDDLGTEVNNGFVSSSLFNCLNQRHLNGQSTIISTNLTMKQLEENYSKRVSSRIMEQYHILPIFGSDIRLKKIYSQSP